MDQATKPPTWYQTDVPEGTPIDKANRFAPDVTHELVHGYGDNVRIHSPHSLVAALAAKISSERTVQPELNDLFRTLYSGLAWLAIHNLPRRQVAVRTPMAAKHGPLGYWVGEIADPDTRIVIADISRAGTVPAETLYGLMTTVINPDHVRKDLLVMARKTDAAGKVTGTDCGYSKIGGSIQDRILLVPDPMVATGGTIVKLLETYKEQGLGEPAMVIVLAMIIAPEAIRRITKAYPNVIIHAARLDRGFSTKRALELMPGLYADEEFGLDEEAYIGPGGGPIGERMTNSYV